jgi:DNA polymerase-3 subunit beta
MPASAGTVDAAAFAAAVAQVAVAAGRDETLPMMTGVRLELNGTTLAMLATDRYRLALREMEWNPQDRDISINALVPARTLNDTAKTLGPLGGEVTLAMAHGGAGEGMIGFAADTRRTTSRLLDGANYPPVRSLFPASHNAQAQLTVAALVEVVRRVALVAERTTPVLLSFGPDGLVVEAGGSEEARASEAMDATFTGEPLTVGFNPQYLIDGLQNLGAPNAILSFVDAYKPAVISPAGDDGEIIPGYRYLIMPIRVTR